MLSYSDNFKYYIKISWPWLLFLIAVFWIVTDLEIYYFIPDGPDTIFSKSLRINIAKYLLEGLALASIAVSWHRHILLGQEVGLRSLVLVDRSVVIYWLVGILVTCLIGLCFAPGLVLFGVSSFGEQYGFLLIVSAALFVCGLILAIQLLYRLSLCLPAIALQRKDYGFKKAWLDSKGVFLQFIILAVMLGFVGRLISQVTDALDSYLSTIESYSTYHIYLCAEPMIDLIFSGLLISVLTQSYRYFSLKQNESKNIEMHVEEGR